MKPIQFYTIKSSGGLKVEISNLGAKITKLLVANRKGEVKDIVLGFRTADEWRTQETYFNAEYRIQTANQQRSQQSAWRHRGFQRQDVGSGGAKHL